MPSLALQSDAVHQGPVPVVEVTDVLMILETRGGPMGSPFHSPDGMHHNVECPVADSTYNDPPKTCLWLCTPCGMCEGMLMLGNGDTQRLPVRV